MCRNTILLLQGLFYPIQNQDAPHTCHGWRILVSCAHSLIEQRIPVGCGSAAHSAWPPKCSMVGQDNDSGKMSLLTSLKHNHQLSELFHQHPHIARIFFFMYFP